MRITDLSSRLDPKSIDPTIIISANLTFAGGRELPIRIDADLWLGSSESARRICALTPLMPENLVNNESFRLAFQTQQQRDQGWLAEFRASFSQRHLDLIETNRALQPKGDVFLTVNFGVQYLEHGLSSRVLAVRETPVAEVADPTKFLQVKFWTMNTWFKVAGSDWIHEYAPALGLGKFMVVEIPGPSSVAATAGAAFAERIPKALDALDRARRELHSGEWPEVIKALRPVWELLREEEEIKKLLLADGFPEEAALDFQSALHNLFNFASKFDHALARDRQTVLPDIKPQKEDAYFAFTLASAVLNVITRKSNRHAD